MILGVDPSLRCTGISDGETTITIKTEPSDLPARADLMRRVNIIIGSIRQFIPKDDSCAIFIEAPMLSMSAATGHLFEMGFWYCSFYREFNGNITIHEVPNATIKRFLGKGSIPKNMIGMQAYKKFGVEFDHDPGLDKVHAFLLHKLGKAVLDGDFIIPDIARRGKGKQKVAKAHAARVKEHRAVQEQAPTS